MASEKDVRDIVARVTADVLNETRSGEAAFKVSDLTAHLRDIAKGDEVAWSISYSTAAATLGSPLVRPGSGDVAWTISYSTSAATLKDRAGSQIK